MIRRISSLAFGFALLFTAAGAFAQEGEGEGGDKPAEEAKPAEGGAAAGASASASTDAMPASKGAFGKAGQIAISGDFQLEFESETSKPPDPPGGEDQKTTTIVFGPALDYFVVDSISVGGQLLYASQSDDNDNSLSAIGIGPRVGYNLGLTENISIWPKLGFQYLMGTAKSKDPVSGNTSEDKQTKMSIGVDVPVLFHPAEHFFIGLGPSFRMDLSSKVKPDGGEEGDGYKDTAFGLQSVVGGWF